MNPVTIADVIRTLNLAAKLERAWRKRVVSSPSAVAASTAFIAAAKAVEKGEWSAHKAALLTFIEQAEKGATEGYSNPGMHCNETLQRMVEFRRLLDLPVR